MAAMTLATAADQRQPAASEVSLTSSYSDSSCDGSPKPSSARTTVTTAKAAKQATESAFHPIKLKQHHISRQREILSKYPQIKELYGPDIRLLPSMLAITAAQIALSIVVATNNVSWPVFFVLAWSIGGLLTHWLSLGNHELCHDLCFAWVEGNEILGTIANFAQAIPSFIAFKKYHTDHHWFLNEANDKHIDPDVPTEWEAKFFTTPFRKTIWVILNPAFYSLRPLFVSPKPPTMKEIANLIVVIGFDIALAYFVSYKAVLFNLASTVLGMGIHPVAGHFMSEHYNLYQDDDRQETYSYYGILNYVTFNVGYHVEHHDFPKISGFRLPQVTAIASEYYESMHPHYSWMKIMYDFITRDDIGPYRRIIRQMTDVHSAAASSSSINIDNKTKGL